MTTTADVHEQKKAWVPLMLEASYRPSGWLGIMCVPTQSGAHSCARQVLLACTPPNPGSHTCACAGWGRGCTTISRGRHLATLRTGSGSPTPWRWRCGGTRRPRPGSLHPLPRRRMRRKVVWWRRRQSCPRPRCLESSYLRQRVQGGPYACPGSPVAVNLTRDCTGFPRKA